MYIYVYIYICMLCMTCIEQYVCVMRGIPTYYTATVYDPQTCYHG